MHLCKRALTAAIVRPSSKNQARFNRIAHLGQKRIGSGRSLESAETDTLPLLSPPHIGSQKEDDEAVAHRIWLDTLPPETILLSTDRFKSVKGETSSGWH